MNNYIYLHENHEFTNDNIEVKLDLAQDTASQPNVVHQVNKNRTSKANNLTGANLYSPTTPTIEGQLTSRQPRHVTASKDQINSQNGQNWLLRTPSISVNGTKANVKLDTIMEGNDVDVEEDYEDLAIDLMARDVRHFDNYSNISSLSQR